MTQSYYFPNWWRALMAVPSSSSQLDWWAPPEDTRSSRYDRLRRAWGDPTDGTPPPFYKPKKEKHLVPALWENFAIFSPDQIVRGVFSAAGFGVSDRALDLCWSYEFNLGHRKRQIDLVLHIRYHDRDEIVIAEAKLQGKEFDQKDLDPTDVLRHEAFHCAKTRRYFLLGGCVPDGWNRGAHGSLGWGDLASIQRDLCNTLSEPEAVRDLLRDMIAAQYLGHEIPLPDGPGNPDVDTLRSRAHALLPSVQTSICRDFIRCGMGHLFCLFKCADDPAPPPFHYLSTEPGAKDIVPGWCPGAGSAATNGLPHWKLPARA